MSPERMVEWVNMIWENPGSDNQYMWCNILAMDVSRYVVGWSHARATGDAALVKVYEAEMTPIFRAINRGIGGISANHQRHHPCYQPMVAILESLRPATPHHLPMPDIRNAEKLLDLIRAGERLQAAELEAARAPAGYHSLGHLGHQAGIASAELYRQRVHRLELLLRQARVQADVPGGHDWVSWKEAVDDLLP